MITILCVPVAVFAMFELSQWQWNRYETKVAVNDLVAAHKDQTPLPPGQVMPVGSTVTDEQQWRPVTASGTFDSAHQVLVRQRPQLDANGFWVVTPFVTGDGTVLAVNRGWLAAGSNATAAPAVPAAPQGQATITGLIRPTEPAAGPEPADIPSGQVSTLNVAEVTADLGMPVYPGYITLTSSDPAQAAGLDPIPLPAQDTGPHLSYSMQWIAFAIMLIAGLGVLIRREAVSRAETEGRPMKSRRRPKAEDRELFDDEYDGAYEEHGDQLTEDIDLTPRQSGDAGGRSQDSEPAETAP